MTASGQTEPGASPLSSVLTHAEPAPSDGEVTGAEGADRYFVTEYRPDIDGLRAIAVLGVLLFHVDLVGLPGGYLGVDVFFAISGYLIIKLIVSDLASKRFHLLEFYERRIRRIVPALMSTVALTLAAAALCQFPADFRKTAESGAAALLSVSNVYFLLNGGYFEGAAQFKALLHTWSLGVEEQFYLAMPATLMVLRRSRTLTQVVFAAGLAGSFALMVAIAQFGALGLSEKTAFFMMPTRGWELLAGGVFSVFPIGAAAGPRVRRLLGWSGLAAVVAAFTGLNIAAMLPGLDAVQPVLGSVLLLNSVAGRDAAVTKLLSAPPLVFLGGISYSIYLVHWPLVSLYKYALQRELDPAAQALCVGLSILLGFLQWRLIERVFRLPRGGRQTVAKPRALWFKFGCVFVTIVGACATVIFTQGAPSRFSQPRLIVDPPSAGEERIVTCEQRGITIRACTRIGAPARRVIAVLGDSHADMMLAEIARIADRADRDVIGYIRWGCPAALGVNASGSSSECSRDRANDIHDLINRSDVDGVLLISRWGFYESGNAWDIKNNWLSDSLDPSIFASGPGQNHIVLRKGVARLIEALPRDINVGIMLPIPQPSFDAGLRARVNAHFTRPISSSIALSEHNHRIAGFKRLLTEMSPAIQGRLRTYDPVGYLCFETRCGVTDADNLYYWDSSHLTGLGVRKLEPLLDTAVGEMATQAHIVSTIAIGQSEQGASPLSPVTTHAESSHGEVTGAEGSGRHFVTE